MNERIKELANQLGPVATIGNWGRVDWADNVYPQLGDKMYAAIDLAEFAELIVTECISVVDDMADPEDSDRYFWAIQNVSQKIREHFGVEE